MWLPRIVRAYHLFHCFGKMSRRFYHRQVMISLGSWGVIWSLFLFTLIGTVGLHSHEAYAEKPLVLLMPVLSTDRVTSQMRGAFDQHMRQQLKENADLNSKVSLLDRETTQAKIKEVGCGTQCSDTRSIFTISKAAQVRFIFIAEIDNEDEIFSIKMRLFDAQLKKLYKSDEDSCEFCTEEEVKAKLTRALTSSGFLNALSMPGPEPVKETKAPPLVFPIKVTTSPKGAIVRINGGELGPAPLQVNLDEGSYKIQISMEGYVDQEKEFNTPEKPSESPIELSFTLKPEPPSEFQATLKSTPPGAIVYLDGEQLKGVSPLTLKIKPGLHSVRFELDGYELNNQEFTTPDYPKDLLIEQTLVAKKKESETQKEPSPPIVTPPPVVTPSLPTPAVATNVVLPPPPSVLGGGTAGLLIGAGILTAGIGTWLVFIHGEVTCDDGRNRLECPTIYSTRGIGAPLMGLGAISLGAGIMGALVRSEWPSAPVVTPSIGGGNVSWSFEF